MNRRAMTVRTGAASIVMPATLAMLALGAACSKSADSSSDRPPAFVGVTDTAASATTLRLATPQKSGSGTPEFCQVIPVDSVSLTLQQTIGKTVAVAVPHAGGMCTYRDSSSGEARVRAIIDVSHLRSPGSAGATLFAMRAQAGTHGVAATDVPGVGDAAFGSSDTTGSYDVTAQGGAFLVQITVSARGVDAKALRAAAAALATRTLAAMQ